MKQITDKDGELRLSVWRVFVMAQIVLFFSVVAKTRISSISTKNTPIFLPCISSGCSTPAAIGRRSWSGAAARWKAGPSASQGRKNGMNTPAAER